jgi:hypothetical protein
MENSWPYDNGTSETGDWPEEQLADPAAERENPPLEVPAAPVNVPAPRARTTARAESFPGEQTMGGHLRSVQYWAQRANVKSCWLCGIRLPAEQMVADGGSVCPDLRWYCRDVWACTGRWTWRLARSAATSQGAAETADTPAEEAMDTDAARPVPV